MEKKKDFSSYPVLIDTEKKTIMVFGIIFIIGILIFFCFFYQSESRRVGLENSDATLFLNR